MAYTINKTNGTIFATVQAGTIDNTSSSLIMIGKNYAGWGESLNENFVKLLESHANSTAPSPAHAGQLWWNSTDGVLTVFDGTEFKPLAASTSAETMPAESLVGDMWYDTVNSQLNIYDGTQYIVVGPSFTATGTSGSIIDVMEDIIGVSHTVVKLFVESEVVAVISKDAAFTPIDADQISGFDAVIYPGIQIAETISGQIPHFTGTATNSELLDDLDSTQFLRSDAPDTTSETLGIINDGGLTIGADSDLKLTLVDDNAFITNSTINGQIVLQATSSTGPKDAITIGIDGTEVRARVQPPLSGLDIVNLNYYNTNLPTDAEIKTQYENNAITSVTTATRLFTPRTIGGISFDGTTDIIPTVGVTQVAGTNNTTIATTAFVDDAVATGTASVTDGLQSVQSFTTSGTWIRPAGISRVYVVVHAGGGGGGGGGGSTATIAADVGGAGGPGGASEEFIIGISASVSITVGTGGSGGSGGTGGGHGGDGGHGTGSSFGTFCSASGGVRGQGGGGAGTSRSGTSGASGTSGVGVGGHLNTVGSNGGKGGRGGTPGFSGIVGGDGGPGAVIVYEYK